MKRDQPSATASLILKTVLFSANDPILRRLFPTDSIRLCNVIALHTLKFPKIFQWIINRQTCRWLILNIEAIMNPGFIGHVTARKAFINNLAVQSIIAGFNQVLIIGAGYDTLGIRMALLNNLLHCFEIDHPATQAVKKSALASLGIPSNLHLIPADLSACSITDILRQQPQWSPTKKTLVIIEGVLMYLPEKAVKNLFQELAHLHKASLHCIFTFMDRQPNGNIQFHTAHPFVNWWLKVKGEQFLWGIPRNDINSYINDIGFKRVDTYGREALDQLLSHGNKPVPKLAAGEIICLACRD